MRTQTIFFPIRWLYEKVADIRNALYERGMFRSHDLGARTISIGNITTGGTGKTPLVAYVAEILAEAGERVGILTRGYGRESSGRVLVSDGKQVLVDARAGGDEPVELARKLLGKAVIVADADRVSAAKWAKEKFGVTAFVLDDGFQHRRAKRDLDIVCVDATDLGGRGRPLREPFRNIVRADAIVVTRANLVDDIQAVITDLRKRTADVPIFAARNRIVGVTRMGEPGVAGWTSLRMAGNDDEVQVLAFCGLGNPDAFFADLLVAFEDESMHDEFDLALVKKFRDHHRYTQANIATLEQQAREANLHALLTTAKDAVKLSGMNFQLPCFVVQGELVIDDPDGFRQMITSS